MEEDGDDDDDISSADSADSSDRAADEECSNTGEQVTPNTDNNCSADLLDPPATPPELADVDSSTALLDP